MFKQNEHKRKLVETRGVAAGLPLFDDSPQVQLPDWIWNGSGISADVYKSMQEKFASDSFVYLRTIIRLGGSATDNEIKQELEWELGRVSARRNDLKKLGVITGFPEETKMGPHKVPNTVWHVNFKQLYKIVNEIQ